MQAVAERTANRDSRETWHTVTGQQRAEQNRSAVVGKDVPRQRNRVKQTPNR
jgi:hypothetical protein